MVSAEGALTYVDGAAGIPRHADRTWARGGAEKASTPRATVSTSPSNLGESRDRIRRPRKRNRHKLAGLMRGDGYLCLEIRAIGAVSQPTIRSFLPRPVFEN
jgi:hypothetical protein